MYNFIECNRNQMYLMPPSLKEWLPAPRTRDTDVKVILPGL